MKRQPTEVVALAVHGLAVLVSALMWFGANKTYERDLWSFGSLPALTQIVCDFHLPAALIASALSQRARAAHRVLERGGVWWTLRLPL